MDLLLTVGDAGTEREVHAAVDPDTPGHELVAALAGGTPPAGVRAWVERTRRELRGDRPVSDAGLLVGDRILLTYGGPPPGWTDRDPAPAAFEVVVVGGADAGRRYPVAAGGELHAGRDESCDIVIDDPQASRRHLHIGAGSKAVAITDLGSTNGTYLDGARIDETVTVHPGQVIAIGATLLAVRRPDHAGPARAAIGYADGRLTFARPPRVQRPTTTPAIRLPSPPEQPPPRRIPLAAAAIPVVLGLAMAYLLGPIMLLFSLMGPVMLAGTLWEDRRTGRRDYRAARKRFDAEMDELAERLATTHADLVRARREAAPDPAILADRIRHQRPELWERRTADRDFAVLRIGTSDLPSHLRLDGDTRGLDTTEAERVETALRSYAVDPDVPVDVDLRTIGVLGVTGAGPERDALLRWLVLQSAALASPADLAVVALIPATDEAGWGWLRWLPQTETLLAGIPGARSVAVEPEDVRAVFQIVDDLVGRRRVAVERGGAPAVGWRPQVLLVLPGEVPVAPSALARVLTDGPALGVTAVVAAPVAERLPGECRAIVDVGTGTGADGSVTLTASGDRIPGIVVDGMAAPLVAELARRLAPLRDSAAATASGEVPSRALLLDLLELPEPDGAGIARRWAARAGGTGLGAPIGVGAAGPIEIDLRRDGPHGLTAGTTGAGKSELLQSMIGALAANHPANRLTFVLIDYKGGAAFKDCVGLPHTVGFFTDLDAHLARRALVSLNAELRRREERLREHGAKDLMELERRHPAAAPANLFIVVDEFAFLKKEVPEFVAGVVDIAQRGRSLGVHLMLATQRPAGVIDDNIRANTNLRIALRVADETDSDDVLDLPDAARIPKSLPGRGFVRLGHSEVTLVQSAYANARSGQGPRRAPTTVRPAPVVSGLRDTGAVHSSGGAEDESRPTDLQRLVAAIRDAHRSAGIPDQPRPWLDPLPARTALPAPATAPPGTGRLAAPLGVADLPAAQAQRPYWIDFGERGHLLVYGTAAAGKTQALRSLAVGLATRLGPDDLQLYGVDFGSGGLRTLAQLPHCGGVVAADQPERVDRLFLLLDQLVARRKVLLAAAGAASLDEYRAGGGALPYVVVLIDGYGAFHQTYLNVDRGQLVDAVARQVADGRAVGLFFVLTADRRNAVPTALSSAISARLVLRMADADEYASLGLPMAIAQAALPPGRGFIDGDEVQVAILGADPSGAGSSGADLSGADLSGVDPSGVGQNAAVAAVADELGRRHPAAGRPPQVAALPDQLARADLPVYATPVLGVPASVAGGGSWVVPVGASGTTDAAALVDLADVPLFAVFGPDRSGRTTTLATLWAGIRDGAAEVEEAYLLAPRRSALVDQPGWQEVAAGLEASERLAGHLGDLLRERLRAPAGRWLVVVDDGDELTDGPAANTLVSLVRRGRDAGLVLICAAQTHVAHRSFGGWLTDLRKAKHGLLLRPEVDVDGELFGQRLPHRASRRFPPGRGYLISRSDIDYIQVALPDPRA